MTLGLAQCVNKGMQRDYSVDKASQEFAYENKNIRITTTGDNSFLSITNEKSTIEIPIEWENPPKHGDPGTILGSTVLDNKIILFTTHSGGDSITRGEIVEYEPGKEKLKCFQIFYGDLGFSKNNPIECVTSYESEYVQKVYWVDGKNQPRVINICKHYLDSADFNFTPTIPEGVTVDISKEYNGSGNFPSGVIQYFITFYEKYSSETNAVYESPLYYISDEDRGGAPNEVHTCSFNISIKADTTTFSHARVYSLVRTSQNALPQAYLVQDVKLESTSGTETNVIDNGVFNTPIQATDIMFLGGNTIKAGTIEQKDNTLFLGNITEVATNVLRDIRNITDKGTLKFDSKFVPTKNSNNSYYPYAPNLDLSSSDIKTFKYLEWYKIGIQFQLASGEWTSVVELGDIQNTIKPNTQDSNTPYEDSSTIENFNNGVWLSALSFTPSEKLKNVLNKNTQIKNWRLVMAEHTSETRTIKSQGLVLPTIFNLKERAENTCYAAPLWTLNTALYVNHFENVEGVDNGEVSRVNPFYHLPSSVFHYKGNENYLSLLPSVIKESSNKDSGESYSLFSITPKIEITRGLPVMGKDAFVLYVTLGIKEQTTGEIFYSRLLRDPNIDDPIFFRTEALLAPYGQRRKKLKELSSISQSLTWESFKDAGLLKGNSNKSIKVSDIENINFTDKIFKPDEIPSGDSLRDDYGVTPTNDTIIKLPTYVRDITFDIDTDIIEDHGNQYFLDANICNFVSPNTNINRGLKFRIVGYTDISNSISDYTIKVEDNVLEGTIYNYPKYNLNTFKLPVAFKPQFTGIKSFPLWPFDNKLYYLNYWHPGGNITQNAVGLGIFNLKSKKFANMWVCGDTTYIDEPIDYSNISELQKVNNESILLNSNIYKADYSNLLIPKRNKVSYIGGGDFDDTISRQPINESASLELLKAAIDDSMNNGVPEDDVDKVGSVSINYKTSEHVVFGLPTTKQGVVNILPNYEPEVSGNSVVYNTSLYPIGSTIVDYLYNIPSTVSINLEIEGPISVEVNLTKSTFVVSVKEQDDNGSNHNLLELNIENLKSLSTDLPGEGQSPGTSIETIYESYNAGETIYNDKGLLININDSNKYIIISNLGKIGGIPDGNVLLEASYILVDKDSPISYIKDGKPYILEELDEDTAVFSKANPYKSNKSSKIDSTKKLFIGEFYTDYNKDTFFGGDPKQCKFIPISKAYPKESTIGWGLEGDTYYQRYDNVRLYEGDESSVNQNIDAVSFMLETYDNLDGDYRTQRGRLDAINLTIDNTNKVLNPIYSQINNYTASYILDTKFGESHYPTLYTWSLPKKQLSDVDNWTSINLSSSLKLDGDKGALTKLKNWNNFLLAFQDKGIALINYNQQTTLSTTEGVPVEISNSGKVSGHYYISTKQGCKNKWSISDSPQGVYFIDSYNKSINMFSKDGIKSLSTINSFQDWIVENEKGIIWNPSDYKGFKSFYDPIHKEVYFINDKTALCYNELLSQFTSFYDYGKLNSMLQVNSYIYGIKNNNIHKMFEGDTYCNLFGESVGYYMTYKITKDPFIDKVWTNVEYRADIFNSGNIVNGNAEKIINETFDTLKVWNEYQSGITNLKNSKYPNAKNKFRVWRYDIPRDENDPRKLDRIRNPWIMMTLEKTKDSENTNKRMEFHDLIIKYLQ